MPHASSSMQRIRREMRARGEATRPQLARACALSLVTVNRVIARLCAGGEVESAGEVSSGGGRPVQLYRLRRTGTWAALLRMERAATGIITCSLELMDPLGARLRQEDARFAHIEERTLDGWLDEHFGHKRRLTCIIVETGSTPLPPTFCRHLAERYATRCHLASMADALAEEREGTATLVFRPADAPLATLYRNGTRHASGALDLLPLPADWQTLDADDHTLVEEMVARLLLILTCTLAPERFVLYGSFWSERLMRRIRYNLTTKLHGAAIPPLSFRRISQQANHAALIRLALDMQ